MKRRYLAANAKGIGAALFVLGVLTSGCGSTASDDDDDDDAVGGVGGLRGGSGGVAGSAARAGAAGSQGGSSGKAAGGSAGQGGAGGAPIDGCDGVDLTQPGVLDLDLRAVTVTGRVTLAGAPLPDEAGSRGALVFQSTSGRSTARVELEASGARTYALRLPPGAYDVSYAANSELCAWPAMPSVPCGGGRLVSGVALMADGVLDVDIPVVSVSGSITLKGGAFPEVGKRGSISFAALGDGGGSVALPASGDASYRLNLLPDTYDVSFTGDPTECTGETPPAVPCNSGTLRASVALTSSGVLDLDVPAVRVTGVVTLNGSLPPTEASSRGQLAFVGEDSGSVLTKAFLPTGATTYDLMLLPGRYAVAYAPSAELCAATAVLSMPCVGGTILPSQDLSSDGVLDLDVRAVTVTGQVTLNGAPLPTESADRGTLSFTNQVDGAGVTRGLELTGAGRYSMRVLAGSYDVDFVANEMLCAAQTLPTMPCTGGSVGRGVVMQADGVYDVDLKRVSVAGVVTLNGAAMPPADGDRGVLTFSVGESSVSTAVFGTSGAVQYALSLWPGQYRVDYDANAALCGPGLSAPPVPCVGGALVLAAPLANDGVLDLDVRSVGVSGNVTLNQMPLPSATADRGSLQFMRVPAEGADSAPFGLGSDTAPSYAMTLTVGRHVFLHGANPMLCTNTEPAPAVPCASQSLVGCAAR